MKVLRTTNFQRAVARVVKELEKTGPVLVTRHHKPSIVLVDPATWARMNGSQDVEAVAVEVQAPIPFRGRRRITLRKRWA